MGEEELKNQDYINTPPEAIKITEKKLNLEDKQKSFLIDIKLLNQRLNSQSQRIRKLQEKLAQILSNQKHYLKVRLPDVLKREKARVSFAAELEQARTLLKSLNKQRFTFLSNSKDAEKRKNRYIGMFTHEEMQKMRRFFDTDHSIDYLLYRKESYKKLKDKHIMFLDEGEKRKLKYLLTKSKNVAEMIQTD